MKKVSKFPLENCISMAFVTVFSLLGFTLSDALAQRTTDQTKDWENFRGEHSSAGTAFLKYNSLTGMVTKANRFLWNSSRAQNNTIETAHAFLLENKNWLGFDGTQLELRPVRDYPYKGNRFVRFQQFRGGVEIAGATLQLTITSQGVTSIGGRVYSDRYVSGTVSVSESEAILIAIKHLGITGQDDGSVVVQKLLPREEELYLEWVYDVSIGDEIVRLSAESGNVIHTVSGRGGVSATKGKTYSKGGLTTTQSSVSTCTTSAAGKGYTSNPSNPNDDTSGDSITLLRLCSNTELDGKYSTVYMYGSSGGPVPHDGSNTFLYDPSPQTANTSCSIENGEDFDFDNHDCSYFDAVNVYYHIDELAYYLDNTIGVTLLDSTYKIDAYVHDADQQGWGVAKVKVGPAESDPRIEFGHRADDWNGGIFYDPAKFEDAIYHEYVHNVVWATSGNYSATPIESSLQEGFADFITAAFTDDAEIAEKLVRCTPLLLDDSPVNAGPQYTYLRCLLYTSPSPRD